MIENQLLTDDKFIELGGVIDNSGIETLYLFKGLGTALKNQEAYFFNLGRTKIKYIHEFEELIKNNN